jgi:radical S-adenosyl methionine domain-containing protein 2
LLTELFRFFHPGNRSNPLRKQLSWKTLRLNLAGGEPSILGDRLLEIVHAARGVGFRVSIISNGSRLTPLAIKQLAPHLTCLGISLDSAVPATNRKIGRVDGKGRLLDIKELVENLQLARQINPQLAVKLNTVVNRRNSREDLCQLADQIRPDRWKILRMLPVMDHSLAVSKEEFSAFVHRHRDFETIQCVEDNHDMYESYLMVDPFGRFFQNQPSLNQAYVYSKPVLSAGAERAFSELAFNTDSFQSRYMGDMAGGNQ